MKKRIGFVVLVIGLLTSIPLLGFGQDPKTMGIAPAWKETEISQSVAMYPPEKIKIVAPDPSLSSQTARLRARWEGIYNETQRPVVIIVEQIAAEGGNLIYGRGRSPMDTSKKWESCSRYRFKLIAEDAISFYVADTMSTVVLKLNNDGELNGTSTTSTSKQLGPTTIKLHKVE